MEQIKQALEAVKKNGTIKPSDVVNSARDEKSPLHSYFDWDDSEAAEKWRETQARELIRSVKILVNAPNPVQVRAFVSLAADRESGAGYRGIVDVMDNDFLRKQLANEIFEQVKRWEEKASILGAIVNFRETKKTAKKLSA